MPRLGGVWSLLHADRLAVRLAVMLSLALAPVGALAVWQTAVVARDDEAAERAALVRRTADAVAGQRTMIESLLISARTLGPIAARRRDAPAECRQLMAQFVEASPLVVFAGLMTVSSTRDCMSDGGGLGAMLGADAVRSVGFDGPAPLVTRWNDGAPGRDAVVSASLPYWEDAEFVGHVVISIREADLGLIRRRDDDGAPRAVFLLNALGEIVHARPGQTEAEAFLPSDPAVFDRAVQRVIGGEDYVLRTGGGTGPVTLATATLIPGQLFAAGLWPGDMASGAGRLNRFVASLALPGLMWAISLVVAYLTVFRMVVRHIREMNGAMRRFALGARDDAPMQPGRAPAEIRELMSTLNRMSRIIMQDEARLTASVAEKTMLLKEVHHRVKNNFQLMSSIVNLQLRKVADPDARRVLKTLQDRVLSLAAIHRAYYDADSVAEVRADRLFGSILEQLAAGISPGGRRARVETDIDPVPLAAEQIVPLAVIVTELATEALRDGADWLHLGLKVAPSGAARLTLTGPTPAPDARPAPETEIRNQLLETLALQLDAQLSRETAERSGAPLRRTVLCFGDAAPEGARG